MKQSLDGMTSYKVLADSYMAEISKCIKMVGNLTKKIRDLWKVFGNSWTLEYRNCDEAVEASKSNQSRFALKKDKDHIWKAGENLFVLEYFLMGLMKRRQYCMLQCASQIDALREIFNDKFGKFEKQKERFGKFIRKIESQLGSGKAHRPCLKNLPGVYDAIEKIYQGFFGDDSDSEDLALDRARFKDFVSNVYSGFKLDLTDREYSKIKLFETSTKDYETLDSLKSKADCMSEILKFLEDKLQQEYPKPQAAKDPNVKTFIIRYDIWHTYMEEVIWYINPRLLKTQKRLWALDHYLNNFSGGRFKLDLEHWLAKLGSWQPDTGQKPGNIVGLE
jgi:hypothetical protein